MLMSHGGRSIWMFPKIVGNFTPNRPLIFGEASNDHLAKSLITLCNNRKHVGEEKRGNHFLVCVGCEHLSKRSGFSLLGGHGHFSES